MIEGNGLLWPAGLWHWVSLNAAINPSITSAKSESRKYLTNPAIDPFVLSYEEQSLVNKKKRFHWMICLSKQPDFLLSWGYAPTYQVAEHEAKNELESLVSGVAPSGRVASTVTPFTRRTFAGR